MSITARFENGVFKPLEPVRVPEGTVVEVHVSSGQLNTAPTALFDSEIFGIWRDRCDLNDSVDSVNRLRRPRF